MNLELLAKIAGQFLSMPGQIAQSREMANRIAIKLASVLVVAVLSLAAFASLVAALFVFLSPRWGADVAWVVVAALFAIAAVAVALYARERTRPPPPRQPAPDILSDLLSGDLADLFNDNKGLILLAAFIGGLMAGRDGDRED